MTLSQGYADSKQTSYELRKCIYSQHRYRDAAHRKYKWLSLAAVRLRTVQTSKLPF